MSWHLKGKGVWKKASCVQRTEMILPEKVWPTQGNGKQNKQKQECLVDNETRGKLKVMCGEVNTADDGEAGGPG